MPIALDEYHLRTKKHDLNPKSLVGNIKLSIWSLKNIDEHYVKNNNQKLVYAIYNGGTSQKKHYLQGTAPKETKDFVVSVLERKKHILSYISAS